MENPRSSLIKKILSQRPMTIKMLHDSLQQQFPVQFEKVTRTQLKKVYLKNLKNFGHIRARICRDENIIKEVQENQAYTIKKKSKDVWLWTLDDSLLAKYQNLTSEELAATPATKILEEINKEKQKNIDFWEGRTQTPTDWKAALEKQGKRTSL